MYIRCEAERRVARRGYEGGFGVEREGDSEYFSPPLLVTADRYYTITTIIIIVIAIILLL